MVSERCSLLSPPPAHPREAAASLPDPALLNQRGGCPQTWLLVSRKDRDGSVLASCPWRPVSPIAA